MSHERMAHMMRCFRPVLGFCHKSYPQARLPQISSYLLNMSCFQARAEDELVGAVPLDYSLSYRSMQSLIVVAGMGFDLLSRIPHFPDSLATSPIHDTVTVDFLNHDTVQGYLAGNLLNDFPPPAYLDTVPDLAIAMSRELHRLRSLDNRLSPDQTEATYHMDVATVLESMLLTFSGSWMHIHSANLPRSELIKSHIDNILQLHSQMRMHSRR